ERQLEEQVLTRLAFPDLLPDRGVVGRAVLDGVVEDRRVGREPGHGEFVDVARERAALQQVAGDVVEPQALAPLVERLRRLHRVTSVDAPARAEARVKFFSESKPGADSISSVQRQRQLPSALPGWFIRDSLPRLRTSCSGAIASAADDDHASPSNAGATS